VSVEPLEDRPPIPLFTGLLGGAILTFLFLTVAIAEIGWAVRVPIHVFVLPLALAGSCLVTRWGARFHFRRSGLATLAVGALLILLVAAGTFISRPFYDVSFDGQGYHQEGVYQLAHAWNPLFTRYISPISIDQNVKLIHFPKGAWIIGAAMYRLTGQIESAKFANLLLIFAAFCVALAVFAGFSRKLSAWPVAMAALVAANPVAVCQVFTFYVDGQMASLLACLAALCYLSIACGNPWIDLLIFETAVLIIQLKFTGLVYVVVFLAGFILLRAWKKRTLRRQVYVAVLALELGTLVFGFNPYVTNTIENGHPFYPLFGHGDFARITLTPNTPPAFLASSPARNLAESIFSRSRDWPPGNTLKAPWQVDRSEWAAFEEPDVLVGGFGPLFAAALVLALMLLGLSLLGPMLPGSLLPGSALPSASLPGAPLPGSALPSTSLPGAPLPGSALPSTSLPGARVFPQRATAAAAAAFAILILVASVLPVSGCWWARYAPQVWLIPLVALAGLGCAGMRPALHGNGQNSDFIGKQFVNEETPHPTSSLGHLLPKGEGKEPPKSQSLGHLLRFPGSDGPHWDSGIGLPEGEGKELLKSQSLGHAIPEGEGKELPKNQSLGDAIPEGEGKELPKNQSLGHLLPKGEGKKLPKSQSLGHAIPEGEGKVLPKNQSLGHAIPEGEGKENFSLSLGERVSAMCRRVRGHFIDLHSGPATPRHLSWLVLLILIVNVAGIATVNFRANRAATRETQESLEDLRSHAPFKVAFGYFRSNRFRLQEAGIPFTEQEANLTCDPEVKENDDLCIGH
jgi:hypothetical protein